MTIRSHLLLLVAGALVPLMLFAVSITSFSWWQQRNSLELRYLERARAMTIALDTELDGSIRVLRSLAFSPDLDDEHMAQFLGRMRRFLAAQPLWSTLAVGDAQWRTVAAVGRNPLSAELPAIANGLLERVSRTRQPAVSGLVHAPDGHYETQIAMPVERDGELRYVMLVSVEQPRWVKFMGQYPVGSGATSTLLDQDGIVIARTADDDRWVGKAAPASLLARTRATAEGAYRNTGFDGQSYYSAHDRSPHWGWTIATGIPAATVEAALLDSSALLAAAAFVSIGLAVLLAFVFGRRIQRPIKALGESARALAEGGEVPTHERSRIAEVDEVEHAFFEAGTMLRERSDALNEALQREQQARREAEEASRAKDHFLAMLGHELRNPLNAIAGAVGVLHQVEPHGPQAMRSREIIDRQAMSLRELVDDLLDVARVTSGKIILHERPVDLAQVVRRTLAMMTAAGRLSRHHVDSDCRQAWVRGDETRLEQVANNLLDNAVKYTPHGGTLIVRAGPHGEDALLEVRDTGVGIAPELLPHVFDLFTQGERTIDRAQGGLGLGLALVRRLVELQGGSVRAESAGAGRGAAFSVRLPLVEAPKPRSTPRGHPGHEVVKPLRIVVVDDNDDGRETLATMLRFGGHEVHEADSGPSAVEAMAEVHPDIAIVDIGLPGFDGYEVARRARAYPGTRDVRLVALTGYGQEEDRRQAAAAGFDWFLVKPADMGALSDILGHV